MMEIIIFLNLIPLLNTIKAANTNLPKKVTCIMMIMILTISAGIFV